VNGSLPTLFHRVVYSTKGRGYSTKSFYTFFINGSGGDFYLIYELDDSRKEELIDTLTNELRVLRAKARVSQQELANRMGVSRQTYGMIETEKQRMTWNHFMLLLLLFRSNDGTAEIIDRIGAYPPELEQYIKLGKKSHK
jgi:DNA-binding XRE family transcriptional regulator